MQELKPCPFCGQLPEIEYHRPRVVQNIFHEEIQQKESYSLTCRTNTASGHFRHLVSLQRGTKEEVVRAWNTRA